MDRSKRFPGGSLKTFLEHVEDEAQVLRARAGVGPTGRLDPRVLTAELKIHLVRIDEIVALSPEDRDLLRSADPGDWSGVGMPLPDGRTLVILHPDQPPERATSTIMEEVCHAHYGHTPSRFERLRGGITKRGYDRDVEDEAYWTGAAALLPAQVVAKAVWRRTADRLASDYGVSIELVEFRIKVLGFWREYRRGLDLVASAS